jgi:phosphoribosylanthranilate isomerase
MYGGTGKTPPWQVLRDEYQHDAWPPLILAGGLRPENVAEGIAVVQPWGVDVASGIESAPGIKDLERVARFISAARKAFRELERGRSSPVA